MTSVPKSSALRAGEPSERAIRREAGPLGAITLHHISNWLSDQYRVGAEQPLSAAIHCSGMNYPKQELRASLDAVRSSNRSAVVRAIVDGNAVGVVLTTLTPELWTVFVRWIYPD
jgi:hypothetical protein